MVQYIRMVPLVGTPFKPLFPDPTNYEEIEVSKLGKRLFGIEKWPPTTQDKA